MPKRKISVKDAFDALDAAGINVRVIQPPPVERDESDDIEIIVREPKVNKPKTLGSATVKILLYAAHSIGCGGTQVGEGDNKHVEGSGVKYYGPGTCIVPTDVAAYLLHQDALARQADDRMLSTRMRSFVITEKRDSFGHRANVGIEVDSLDMSDMIRGGNIYTI